MKQFLCQQAKVFTPRLFTYIHTYIFVCVCTCVSVLTRTVWAGNNLKFALAVCTCSKCLIARISLNQLGLLPGTELRFK